MGYKDFEEWCDEQDKEMLEKNKCRFCKKELKMDDDELNMYLKKKSYEIYDPITRKLIDLKKHSGAECHLLIFIQYLDSMDFYVVRKSEDRIIGKLCFYNFDRLEYIFEPCPYIGTKKSGYGVDLKQMELFEIGKFMRKCLKQIREITKNNNKKNGQERI